MKRRLGDRRGRPRFEIVGDLWGTLDTVIGLPLVNVGKGGVLVQSPVPLAPESVHHVSIDCDGQPTHASVQVRHVRPVEGADGRQQYLVGLLFLSTPSALLAQINAWMGEGPATVTEGA
jgi:hypothetical protein